MAGTSSGAAPVVSKFPRAAPDVPRTGVQWAEMGESNHDADSGVDSGRGLESVWILGGKEGEEGKALAVVVASWGTECNGRLLWKKRG